MEKKEEVVVQFTVEGSEIKLTPSIVEKFIVGNNANITLPEFKFFVELCKVRKLNPFLKEAYLIKYGANPAQIVVGKDAIVKKAVRNPKFNGREQGVIVETESGEIVHRKGTFKLAKEKLLGGWARAHRKDWEFPIEITVSFEEVAQKTKDGSLNSNWASKGATMVEKVALVRALREAFVDELGGMIDEDEAWGDKDLSSHVIVEQPEKIEQEVVLDET